MLKKLGKGFLILAFLPFVAIYWIWKNEDMDNKTKGLLTGGVVIFLIFAVAAGSSDTSLEANETTNTTNNNQVAEQQEEKPQPDKHDAYFAGMDYVKSTLKSPSTADFPSFGFTLPESRVQKIDTNTYQMSSWVDSQNSFGAEIRTNWSAKVKYKGSGQTVEHTNWELQSLTVDGEKIY